MKILPRKDLWELTLQSLQCLEEARRPFSEDVSSRQHHINAIRHLRERAIADGDYQIAAKIAHEMNELNIPMEPTAEEFTGKTSVTDKISAAFLILRSILHARCDDVSDMVLLANADAEIKKGRIILEGMIKDPLNRELKQALENTLIEYDAAAVISCSDDLTITRERALEQQRGRSI